jgi:hypothetical protein
MNPKTAAKWLTGVAATVIIGLVASTAPSSADDTGSDGSRVDRQSNFRVDTSWD